MHLFPYQQVGSASGFAVFLVIAYLIIWTLTLVSALRNNMLSEIIRFMWVFIIVMAPLIGIVLYFTVAPSRTPRGIASLADSEGHARMAGVYEKTEWKNR